VRGSGLKRDPPATQGEGFDLEKGGVPANTAGGAVLRVPGAKGWLLSMRKKAIILIFLRGLEGGSPVVRKIHACSDSSWGGGAG